MANLRLRRGAQPSDVLVVCHGNFCRSPFVAALLASALPELHVRSAGTAAGPIGQINPELVPLLRERGLPVELAPPCQLTADLVRGARLIVTATHEHRLAVIDLDRSAATRAVTLKELARYVAEPPRPAGLDAVLARVAEAVASPAAVDQDDDLADPYGLGAPAYAVLAATVDPLVALVAGAVRG